MIKHNEDLIKQQVLFNDNEPVVEQINTQFDNSNNSDSVNKQVIFNNDEYAPIAEDELTDSLSAELNQVQLSQDIVNIEGRKPSWLWRVIFIACFTLLLIELGDFFITGFENSPIITSIYGLLFIAIFLIAGNSLWRELVGLSQFKSRQKEKNKATELLAELHMVDNETTSSPQKNKKAIELCETINKNLPCDLAFDKDNNLEEWHKAISNEHNSAELVQIYSRVVLSKVDEKALNEIAKFSTEAVVLVALSPIAILDMFILLTRNLRMINKVAGLYGLKLGYWSRIQLIKQVFVNMAYAGASELIADLGTDLLGAEMLGKLSARFAQGLGVGLLTARLGAKTMELCRPIPFEDKPKLSQVKKKIVQQIQVLVSRK